MAAHPSAALRNIALLGQAGTGKTTLIEQLLLGAGALKTAGAVERGTTVCDYDPLEREHLHSLSAKLVTLEHGGARLNLLDTPGLPDFAGAALGVLPAVECAAIVVSAAGGVDSTARRMMERAHARNLCRLVIVNKLDADRAHTEELLADLQEAFGKECLPLNLPGARSGVVDCYFQPSGEATAFSSVVEAHRRIVDQVVEVDEALMKVYLERGEVRPAELHAPFEKALREGHLIPVCFVSGKTGEGVKELLEVFAKLAPDPSEGNPPTFISGEGEAARQVTTQVDAGRHVVAHVFKIENDPFVGRFGIFRVHQGTVTKDTQLFVGTAKKPFKVAHLFRVHGKEHKEIDRAGPGDIAAVAKVEELHQGAVLHDSHDEDHLHAMPVAYPAPMFGLAVEPKSKSDDQKLLAALHKLTAEDACLLIERSGDTHELVLRGLGELHLRVTLERLRERFHVEVETHPPKIPYRETVLGKAEGHHRHKKQTGGAGQFGEVFLRVEPLDRGAGFQFENDVFGGAIPTQFIPAVEKGVRQALVKGVLAGYPVLDVKVTVHDGKSHAVDSKEVAFVTAGRKAFMDAFNKARPVLLEPHVRLEVLVPSSHLGDVTGDLSSRRGRVNGTDTRPGGMVLITGTAPLAELTDYQAKLKSMTSGQGSYSVEASHYDAVPPQVQEQLARAYRPAAEED